MKTLNLKFQVGEKTNMQFCFKHSAFIQTFIFQHKDLFWCKIVVKIVFEKQQQQSL